MKIILRQSVENLGSPGDVVRVKDGYARNFLIPKKLAVPLTDSNLKQFEQEKKRLAIQEAKAIGEAQKIADAFAGTRLVFAKKSGLEGVLYGSVTAAEIAEALEAKGCEVDKRRLIIAEPIKRLGEFRVLARLHPEVDLEIDVVVEPEDGVYPEVTEETASEPAAEVSAPEEVAADEPKPEEAAAPAAEAEEEVKPAGEEAPE